MNTKPIPGRLRYRLLSFFERNPDEELLYGDALVKFDVTDIALKSALERMRKHGEVAVPCPTGTFSPHPIRPAH